MRFFRYIVFSCFFLFSTQFIFSIEIEIQKSQQAQKSDEIFYFLEDNQFNPQKQLLTNSQSTLFPYNIIVSNNPTEKKIANRKLIVVFPQEIVTNYIPQILSFIELIQSKEWDYAIEILFSANDTTTNPISTNKYSFAGTDTYINSLKNTDTVASILISPQENTSFTSNFSLLEDMIKISPSGEVTENVNRLVELGFFSTIINSMADADVTYYMEGVLLSFHRLNIIKGSPLIGNWLNNDIPSIAVDINKTNAHKIFAMLQSLLVEFPNNDFSNIDVNYGFFEFFSLTFFISETMYLIVFLCSAAVILFIFCHLSFIKGVHKNIHKKELAKTWYIFPIIIVFTTGILFLSQLIVSSFNIDNSKFQLFSLIAKLTYTILFALLLSSLRYLLKLPLTGFIYAYMLSINAAFNILLFSLIEITLMPLFIFQYLIIQASQKVRKLGPIIVCYILMFFPFIPFIINFANSNAIFQLNDIINAGLGTNLLIAFFMLPFQIMTIRILIRLKIWGTRIKFNYKNLYIKLGILVLVLLLFTGLTFYFSQTIPNAIETSEQNTIQEDSFEIHETSVDKYGNVENTLTIKTDEKILHYSIELYSRKPIPIYSANYPFDIMNKPLTAVFTLDDNPPNPLQLTFLSSSKDSIRYSLVALVNTPNGIEKIAINRVFEARE